MRLADAMVIVAWGCLALAGALFALMLAGILLIGDKPQDPQRYLFEVGTAWAALVGGVAVCALGVWMARRRWRRAEAEPPVHNR